MNKLNHLLKRIASVAVCLLLLTQFALINVFAVETVIFTLDCGSFSPGNEVTAVCGIDNAPGIGGFVIKIQLPEGFNYVNKSYEAAHDVMDDANVRYAEDKGLLYVVWETSAGKGISKKGDIFTVKFLADISATNESYDFTFDVNECYTDDVSPKNIAVKTVKGVAMRGINAAVSAVIKKINEIGTVEYTEVCLSKIIAAEEAYKALTVAERRAVSNYQTLLDARNTYEKLASETFAAQEKAAAQNWRETHKAILDKTIETLVLSDKANLEKAIAAWNELPTNTQKALLIEDKNLLNKLAVRMEELEKINEGKIKEEALKKEALEYEKKLKEDWAQLFSLSVDTVTADYAQPVNIALTEANGYCLMNSYCNEYLKEEIEFLTALSEKIAGINGESTDSGFNAASFLKNYGYLMAMSVEDITVDDIEDIRIAYQLLSLLDAQSQAELIKEKELLEKFMQRADELESENADGNDSQTITQTITVPGASTYNMQLSDPDNALFHIDNNESGRFIILSIVTLISFLVFAATLTSYLVLKRKEEKESREGE